MESVKLTWPQEAFEEFEKFIDNLKIDEKIKDKILQEADILVTETAILQVRTRTR